MERVLESKDETMRITRRQTNMLIFFFILFYYNFVNVALYSGSIEAIKNSLLGMFLYFATIYDLKTHKIPNKVTGFMVFVGVYFGLILEGISYLKTAILIILGLFLFSVFGLMGAGDIKLWMGIALLTTFKDSLYIIFFAEALFILFSVLTNKETAKTDILGLTKSHAYPFAPFLLFGTICRQLIQIF